MNALRVLVAVWGAAMLAVGRVPVAAGQDTPLPEGAGKRILERACRSCHGLDQVTSNMLEQARWKDIVDEMRTYGAAVNDDEASTLIDYLAKNFGPKKSSSAR